MKLAVGPGGCLTAATPRICASFQGQVAQMRTDENVIGLSDQCDRNYSLDRSRLGLYYVRKVEPTTRWENSDGAQRRHAEGFIPGHSEIDRTTACSSIVFFGLLAWARLNARLPS